MKVVLNPDKDLVATIRTKLKENDGYCPCRVVKNKDTQCMCTDFIENTSEGECHCGLYIKIKD